MFIRKKKFKNKDGSERIYADLVESIRVGGKPKSNTLFTFGRIDTPEGTRNFENVCRHFLEHSHELTFLNPKEDIQNDWSKTFGPTLVFRRMWEDLGLAGVLKQHLNSVGAEFDIADCLFNLVLNRLVEPSSKRATCDWQDTIYGINEYEYQHYYRAMDHLIERKDEIEKSVYMKMRDLFSLSIDVVLFDTTTIVYYGEGEETEDLLARGFSKAKRGDLKQVVIGVMMSKQGVPLGHEVFAGNKNDVTCFKEIIDKISKKFQIDKVVLVGDRGMISRKNIKHLADSGYQYILGYRMRTIPKADRQAVLSKANLKVIKQKSLHWKEVNYEGQRLLVCYNPERAKKDAAKRDDIVSRLRERLKCDADVKTIVTNQDYKKFLIITGAAPKVDEQKIKDDAMYDGIYVITSNTKLKGGEIISGYKDLWQIEQGFRRLKSELELGPMYHWKDRRIRAHTMICFLALIVRTTFYKKLREKYEDASYPKTLRDLKGLCATQIQLRNEPMIIRTELRAGAKQSFRAIGMKFPPRLLSGNSSDLIV
jgi:transposase